MSTRGKEHNSPDLSVENERVDPHTPEDCRISEVRTLSTRQERRPFGHQDHSHGGRIQNIAESLDPDMPNWIRRGRGVPQTEVGKLALLRSVTGGIEELWYCRVHPPPDAMLHRRS